MFIVSNMRTGPNSVRSSMLIVWNPRKGPNSVRSSMFIVSNPKEPELRQEFHVPG